MIDLICHGGYAIYMVVITISKTKYDTLKKKAHAYDILSKRVKSGGFFGESRKSQK